MRNLLRCILHWVRMLTTSRDNKTPDVIRLGGIILGVQFVALAGWDSMALRHDFDPMAYGGGAAALLASIGAALRMKKSDEPGD